MKKILLLGGTSWHSTVDYYRMINKQVQQRLGGITSSDLYLHSVNFNTFHQYQVDGNWQAIADAYIKDVEALKHLEIEGVVICANTMHQVAESVEQETKLPILHIAEGIGRYAKAICNNENISLGVLGTEFTMEMPFYRKSLEARNISMLVPNDDERKEINRIIFEELVAGNVYESSRDFYLEQVNELSQAGADAVVMGCTEIGMLIDQSITKVRLIDSLQAHVDYIVDWQLG